MKTTFDLPDELVRRLKLRALRERRKLKDSVADVLRAGLAAQADERVPAAIAKDRRTGLPVIQCRRKAHAELTPERVSDILIGQEAGWIRESS